MTASFTIFVCSTFSALSQERESVLDAIRRLKLQQDSMEFFGARAEQTVAAALAVLSSVVGSWTAQRDAGGSARPLPLQSYLSIPS
jgi:hypothetical protein